MAVPQTTLSANMLVGATTASVRDTLGFATSSDADDLVQIGTEQMLVAGGLATNSWSSITRGYNGTTAAAHTSGDTVTRIVRGWTDLGRIHTILKSPNANDDAYLLICIEAVDAWMSGEIGRFLGPSTDPVRTFDVPEYATGLRVPGGVRSITSLKLRRYTGATQETANAADYVLRPKPWDTLPGLTYDRIEFVDRAWLGSIWAFYPGIDTVEITSSTFGPAEVPANLARICDTVVVWLNQSRTSGAAGILGSLDTGELVVNRVLTPLDRWTMQKYTDAVQDYSWVSGRG